MMREWINLRLGRRRAKNEEEERLDSGGKCGKMTRDERDGSKLI